MEARRLETRARALRFASTRRLLVRLLGILPVGKLLLAASDEPETMAHGRRARRGGVHHDRHHRPEENRQPRFDPRLEACIPTGQRCPSHKPRGKKGRRLSCAQCCQRLVVTDARGKRVCACTPAGQSCISGGASQCCSGLCDGSICQAGSTCAQHCPGCCSGDDICQAGTSAAACGAGGAVCTACPGTALCDASGACLACDVCPSGCPFTSVQAAIDATSPRLSTIRVCAGIYAGNLTITRDLTLIGAGDGNAAGDTILQGTGSTSAVSISDNNQDVTLQALRITGGGGAATQGGGVSHLGRSLTMTDCTVTGNSVAASGGGVFSASGRSVVMTRCTVSDNHATSGAEPGGGIVNSGQMTLTYCLINGNTAAGHFGGGIYSTDATGDLTLINCVVSGNGAAFGAGILVNAGILQLSDGSSVTGNTAGVRGGGIYNFASTTLNASSVTGNSAANDGAGIYNQAGGTVSLQNGSSVNGNTVGGTPNNCAGDLSGYSGSGCAP